MDNSFFKGLLFFAAGYCTASYLLTGKLFGSVVKTTDTTETTEAGVAANVNKVVNNVKSWIKTNFADSNLTDAEVETFAKEATGVKTTNQTITGSESGSDGTEPAYDGTDAGSGHIGAIFMSNYPMNPNNQYFRGQDITGYSPDSNNMRYANGYNRRSLESDFRWSFN